MTAVHSDDLDLLERLGGSEATVHRAVVRTTGRVVVVKRAPWDRPDVAARLEREAGILHRVQHPSLVRLLQVLEDEVGRTLVLGHAPGGSLAAQVETHGPLPARDVADLGARLAQALAALHQHGVVHRDVHPANVLIDAELQPLLADLDHALDERSGHLPSDEEVVGHPDHVDPGLFAGRPQGPASDVHALATTLWTAATGAPPARSDPADPVTLPTDGRVPPPLHEVLRACLTGDLDAGGAATRLQVAATVLRTSSPDSWPPPTPRAQQIPPPAAPTAAQPALVAGAGESTTRRWGTPPQRRTGTPGVLGATPSRRAQHLLLAGLGTVALLTAGWLLAGRAGGAAAAAARIAVPPPACAGASQPATDGTAVEPVFADLDGDGCSQALWLDGGVLHTRDGAYRVGHPEDVLVVGDWDGDGTWGVALYRPRTGELFLFDAPLGPDARSRPAVQLPAGGTPLVIDDGVSHRVELVPDA